MRAFVCDCLLTGAPCVHMHTGVVVHVLRMNMADRGCQSPQQVLLQEHPLLSSLTLEMDVALQVARFAGILLRRIRKVLRPVLGKRKLRSVGDRNYQVYQSLLRGYRPLNYSNFFSSIDYENEMIGRGHRIINM